MSDERVLNILLKALNTTKFNDLICALFSRQIDYKIEFYSITRRQRRVEFVPLAAGGYRNHHLIECAKSLHLEQHVDRLMNSTWHLAEECFYKTDGHIRKCHENVNSHRAR